MKYNRFFIIILVLLFATPIFGQNKQKEKRLLIPYRKGNLWGFANEKMKIVIPPQFEKAGFFKLNNNLFYAEGILHGKPVIITEEGKFMDDEFSSGQSDWIEFGINIEWYQDKKEDAALSTNGKHGFRLENGMLHLAPVYDDASNFLQNESLAIMRLKDTKKLGVVDTSGNIKIPFEYDGLFPINSDALIFAARVGRTWRIIDGTNTRVHASDFDAVFEPVNDRVRAMKGGKYGYLDRNGKEAIPFKYSSAFDFSSDPAIFNFALVGIDGFQFFIDLKGREFMER